MCVTEGFLSKVMEARRKGDIFQVLKENIFYYKFYVQQNYSLGIKEK